MKRLSETWFAEGYIDFELKKYTLLSYLQEINNYFGENKLYPQLSDLVFHFNNLVAFRENKKFLQEHFPKKLTGIQIEKLQVLYEQMIDDSDLMQELEEIINYAAILVSCSSQKYFIVRHAERASAMAGDPPLSSEGSKQAQDLAVQLQNAKITKIYSTDYIRTRKTAEPLATKLGIPVEIYEARNPEALVSRVKGFPKGNFLIVGHSNTVDDLVNGFTGTKTIAADLPETEYGMIYLVKKKKNNITLEKSALPKHTPR